MAQRISRTKKTLVIAAVGALSLGGAGAAFAYWTSTGEGTGAATTGAPELFTIAALPSADDPLTPGGPGQTIVFSVTNPGDGSQLLGPVAVFIATSDGSPDGTPWVPTGDCDIADYTATITTQPTQGELAPGATATGGLATVVMANTAENQDACQGQTVPLLFTTDSTVV